MVRAEAQSTGDAQTDRRAVLGAGLALAAATTLPLSMPAPAKANKVLSSDWEEVSIIDGDINGSVTNPLALASSAHRDQHMLCAAIDQLATDEPRIGSGAGVADHALMVQVKLSLDDGIVVLDIGFTGSDPNHGEHRPLQMGFCLQTLRTVKCCSRAAVAGLSR